VDTSVAQISKNNHTHHTNQSIKCNTTLLKITICLTKVGFKCKTHK